MSDPASFTAEEFDKIEALLPELQDRKYELGGIKTFVENYLQPRLKKKWEATAIKDEMIRRGMDKEVAMCRVAMLYGWRENWSEPTAAERLQKMFAEGNLPDHPMFRLHPAEWPKHIKRNKIYTLPIPLPHVMEVKGPLPGNNIEHQAMLRKKGKIVLPQKTIWKWVYQNMHIPDLSQYDAPNGPAYSLYKSALDNPTKFLSDYERKYGGGESDAEKIKLRRHLEDDDRRQMKFIRALIQERKKLKAAKKKQRSG